MSPKVLLPLYYPLRFRVFAGETLITPSKRASSVPYRTDCTVYPSVPKSSADMTHTTHGSKTVQFIINGPDIPEALLEAHEEGHVVFFCGAGISYPAGLPGFKELVDDVYSILGTKRNDLEDEAYERWQFDGVLELLERRIPGHRHSVRKAIHERLKPNLTLSGATDTHQALLHLAKKRDGESHLVTTNFDRIFEEVATTNGKNMAGYCAPFLPVPKASRWNGLVYLHGLLPCDDELVADLQRIVVTSGDFGLAYLVDRWAARFVSELFRNFVVCFVGYSINDPVLRYMMDALAADRMLGESPPQAYAFGDHNPENRRKKEIEWRAKNVRPILYEVPMGSHDHSALHRTLKEWAETYRDGILGKERIVSDLAQSRPSDSTQQDDFVSRMLWALSDRSGLPAKKFAEATPVPRFEWIKVFADKRFQHHDLERFDVYPHNNSNEDLKFSLVARPGRYDIAAPMNLVAFNLVGTAWDNTMHHIGNWLLNFLNEPEFIFWIEEHGGLLHPQMRFLVSRRLDELAQWESESVDKLEQLLKVSPLAVPSDQMRILLRMIVDGKASKGNLHSLFELGNQLKHEGFTLSFRTRLKEAFAPRIRFSRPFSWVDGEISDQDGPFNRIGCDLTLATQHPRAVFRAGGSGDHWSIALPKLLPDIQTLLIDFFEMAQAVSNDADQRSYWYLPSIESHWQNRSHKEWVVLIEMLRDGWVSLSETEPDTAAQIASEWSTFPYYTFKRLALFAATQLESLVPEVWMAWLMADYANTLWATETRREVLRLLASKGSRLSPKEMANLEAVILSGPPREMCRVDVAPADWQRTVDRGIWIRLAKLKSAGCIISQSAMQLLAELERTNPNWKFSKHQREEFTSWVSGTGDPDFGEFEQIERTPSDPNLLREFLLRPSSEDDDWAAFCKSDFELASDALIALADDNEWPVRRWADALSEWSDKEFTQKSWLKIAVPLTAVPDQLVKELTHSIAWWLERVSESLEIESLNEVDASFWHLCSNILKLDECQLGDSVDGVTTAINHPVGLTTRALLNVWYSLKPNDSELLQDPIRGLFTRICEVRDSNLIHGRLLLASDAIALFRVDSAWSRKNLLPLFDWSGDRSEAAAAWNGYLWSARLYRPLLVELKSAFLETASHLEELGKHSNHYPALLVHVALNMPAGYSESEFQQTFQKLDTNELQMALNALVNALEASREQAAEFWRNRIAVFWRRIWPKSVELMTHNISESIARLTIFAREEFPNALRLTKEWLQPLDDPMFAIYTLHESSLASKSPDSALDLLDRIVATPDYTPLHLDDSLAAISTGNPALTQDPRYIRLLKIV